MKKHDTPTVPTMRTASERIGIFEAGLFEMERRRDKLIAACHTFREFIRSERKAEGWSLELSDEPANEPAVAALRAPQEGDTTTKS